MAIPNQHLNQTVTLTIKDNIIEDVNKHHQNQRLQKSSYDTKGSLTGLEYLLFSGSLHANSKIDDKESISLVNLFCTLPKLERWHHTAINFNDIFLSITPEEWYECKMEKKGNLFTEGNYIYPYLYFVQRLAANFKVLLKYGADLTNPNTYDLTLKPNPMWRLNPNRPKTFIATECSQHFNVITLFYRHLFRSEFRKTSRGYGAGMGWDWLLNNFDLNQGKLFLKILHLLLITYHYQGGDKQAVQYTLHGGVMEIAMKLQAFASSRELIACDIKVDNVITQANDEIIATIQQYQHTSLPYEVEKTLHPATAGRIYIEHTNFFPCSHFALIVLGFQNLGKSKQETEHFPQRLKVMIDWVAEQQPLYKDDRENAYDTVVNSGYLDDFSYVNLLWSGKTILSGRNRFTTSDFSAKLRESIQQEKENTEPEGREASTVCNQFCLVQ